jgi:hypothetical protein
MSIENVIAMRMRFFKGDLLMFAVLSQSYVSGLETPCF